LLRGLTEVQHISGVIAETQDYATAVVGCLRYRMICDANGEAKI
jgi:hypothetical protein